MTISEVIEYFTSQNCDCTPIEGGNLSGVGIKIKNKSNLRTYYFQIYSGGEASDTSVMHACDRLIVKYPPHLSHLMKPAEAKPKGKKQ